MSEALKLASLAGSLGEVPVGAVVVLNENIVGRGFNRRELLSSPIEHAELSALRQAAKNLGSWRLINARVYSTLEPCIMCAGALVHARVSEVYYGAADKKFGALYSLYTLGSDSRLNHQFKTQGGLMEQEASQLLRDFFREVRGLKDNLDD